MRVSTKLSAAFGAAISIGLVVGLIGYNGIQGADESIDGLYHSNFLPVTALSDLSIRAQSHAGDMYRHVIAPDKSAMDRLVADMREDEKAVASQLDTFRASDMSSEERAAFGNLEKDWRLYLDVVNKAIPLSESGQDKEAADLLNGEGARTFNEMKAEIGKLIELNKTQAKDSYEASDVAVTSATRWSVIVLVLAAVSLAGIGFSIRRNLLNQLGCEPDELVAATRRIAQGDLATLVRSDQGGADSVMASIREMQEQLRSMFSEISRGARQLSVAATDLRSLAVESANRAGAQNDAASTIAAAVEELTVSVSHINDNTHQAQKQAVEARKLAEDGNTIIRQSLDEVGRIEASVSETSNVIASLEQESANISAIVKVIREIADQTNLLALNAAIEAARAGEQGRGFAVVADEVRKLAERTGHSTQEISQLIDRIQQGTHRAAESMAGGMKRVQSGVSLSSRAGEAIAGISGSVAKASDQVSDISSALSEQTAASTDIARNVEVIAGMSQENSVSAGKVTEASTQMSALSETLLKEIARFRV